MKSFPDLPSVSDGHLFQLLGCMAAAFGASLLALAQTLEKRAFDPDLVGIQAVE